jgi:hypothetical protein
MNLNRSYNFIKRDNKKARRKTLIIMATIIFTLGIMYVDRRLHLVNQIISNIFYLLVTLSVGIFIVKYSVYKIIGTLYLDSSKVTFNYNNDSQTIRLNEITFFYIRYQGSVNDYSLAEMFSRSLREKSGIDNIIEISTASNHYRFNCHFLGPNEDLFLQNYCDHLNSINVKTEYEYAT